MKKETKEATPEKETTPDSDIGPNPVTHIDESGAVRGLDDQPKPEPAAKPEPDDACTHGNEAATCEVCADPWHPEVSDNSRRSKKKRLRRKIKEGVELTDAERAWYDKSHRRPKKKPADTDEPTAPAFDAHASDTVDTPQQPTGWVPPPRPDAAPRPQPVAAKPTGDSKAGAKGGQESSEQRTKREAETTGMAVGATVAWWVQFCHSECERLGKPWPIPPLPLPPAGAPKEGEIDERGMSNSQRIVLRIAASAGESAQRVSEKYGLRVPYQDEAITLAAVAIPTVLWRAAVADTAVPQAEAQRAQQAKDANPKVKPDHKPNGKTRHAGGGKKAKTPEPPATGNVTDDEPGAGGWPE